MVVPAYNEEPRILPSLQEIEAFLARQAYPWEVVVVDDGSRDQTAPLVSAFSEGRPWLRLLRYAHRGKGHAVKQGMLAAQGAYRFLCDADLSMPLEELPRFLPPQVEGYEVVIGSREAAGARRYGEPALRHFLGRGFNLITQLVAVPGILDTQCGFKCYQGRVAQELFSRQRLDGFGFDVEILFLAQRRGYRILELPIPWYYGRHSKVNPVRDSLRVFYETLLVRWNYLRGYYGR